MNNNIKKGIATAMLASTLLTGCSSKTDKSDDGMHVAVLFGDNSATIAEVTNFYMHNNVLCFTLADGTKMYVDAENAIYFDKVTDYDKVENIARGLIGDDGEIYYYKDGEISSYEDAKSLVKTK